MQVSANGNEIIRVEDLHKSFGSLHVLKGVTEHISKGEVVSVIGPSGGGKSTFLRCLNLLRFRIPVIFILMMLTLQIRTLISMSTVRKWVWYSSTLMYSTT